MTLSQFFELRYSKRFRLFTGILAFVAGVVNFGIIPAVGARFMVYFLGIPPELTAFGWVIPTYIPLMAVFLSVTLFITLAGGFITIMITDCVEGILSQLFYLIIIVALLAICAVTFLNHPDFAAQAAAAHAETAAIAGAQIQRQMEVPVALSHFLPIGVKGVLCAILLTGSSIAGGGILARQIFGEAIPLNGVQTGTSPESAFRS